MRKVTFNNETRTAIEKILGEFLPNHEANPFIGKPFKGSVILDNHMQYFSIGIYIDMDEVANLDMTSNESVFTYLTEQKEKLYDFLDITMLSNSMEELWDGDIEIIDNDCDNPKCDKKCNMVLLRTSPIHIFRYFRIIDQTMYDIVEWEKNDAAEFYIDIKVTNDDHEEKIYKVYFDDEISHNIAFETEVTYRAINPAPEVHEYLGLIGFEIE